MSNDNLVKKVESLEAKIVAQGFVIRALIEQSMRPESGDAFDRIHMGAKRSLLAATYDHPELKPALEEIKAIFDGYVLE